MMQRTQGFRQVRAARCVILLLLCTVEVGRRERSSIPCATRAWERPRDAGRGIIVRSCCRTDSAAAPPPLSRVIGLRVDLLGAAPPPTRVRCLCLPSHSPPFALSFSSLRRPRVWGRRDLAAAAGEGRCRSLQPSRARRQALWRPAGGRRWGLSLCVAAADARSARGGATAGWSAPPAGSGAAEQPPRGVPGSLLLLHSGELDLGFSGG